MTDLTDFLLARIAEDETMVRVVQRRGMSPIEVFAQVGGTRTEITPPWGPARLMAECETKRRIVMRCASHFTRTPHPDTDPASADTAIAFTLLTLASPYRDHPDYSPGWAT